MPPEIQIIARLEAAAVGMKYFYTGKLCKNNHLSLRYVTSGACVGCTKVRRVQPFNSRTKHLALCPMTLLYVPGTFPRELRIMLRHKVQTFIYDWLQKTYPEQVTPEIAAEIQRHNASKLITNDPHEVP